MPVTVLSVAGISLLTRMTRASMLEVFDQPYITALRAKGLRERFIINRHALKNALVPVVSVFGAIISRLLCGSLVVENFFLMPGLGAYILGAVTHRDHNALLGSAVVLTVILLVVDLLADVVYALIDPQIKRRYSKGAER